jgi:regulator of nonsense transcripts 3
MPEEEESSTKISSEKQEKAPKKPKGFLNKIVIRKLPPNLSSEQFLEQISPLPEIIDFYFCKPDWTLGGEATTRAYIEFLHEEDVSLLIYFDPSLESLECFYSLAFNIYGKIRWICFCGLN